MEGTTGLTTWSKWVSQRVLSLVCDLAEAVREQQRMYDVKRNMGRPVQPGTAPFSMDLWMDDDSKAAGERKDGGGDDEDGSGGKRGPRYTVTVLDADRPRAAVPSCWCRRGASTSSCSGT